MGSPTPPFTYPPILARFREKRQADFDNSYLTIAPLPSSLMLD